MVKYKVNPCTIVCDRNVLSSYASPFRGFQLFSEPRTSPHKNKSCLGNLLLLLLPKLSLGWCTAGGIFAIVTQALIYLRIRVLSLFH